MKILILGLGKSGTTAFYYKVLNSRPRNTLGIFEPRESIELPRDDEKDVVAKVLLEYNINKLYFRNFDRKILLVRDPRDRLISQLLYFVWNDGFFDNDKLLSNYINLLKDKEKDPALVSVLTLVELIDTFGKDFTQSTIDSVSSILNFCDDNKDFFKMRYEDFVDEKFSDLEAYLGFKLEGKIELPHNLKRVARTKYYGDWQNWFTERDIEFFRPHFHVYMERFGYDDGWKIEKKQIIYSEYSSDYVCSLVKDRKAKERLRSLKSFKNNLFCFLKKFSHITLF